MDLEAQSVSAAGLTEPFEIDAFSRECLLNGWDDVGLTLRLKDAIAAFEQRREAASA